MIDRRLPHHQPGSVRNVHLRHHLALAGREEALFADNAIAWLHRVASGLPPALHNAAAALIAAAADGTDLIDDACAKKPSPSSPGTDPPRPAARVSGAMTRHRCPALVN